MTAGELCNREVVVAYRNMSIAQAANLMREHHVGSLVVVVDRLSERVPVGMLTDRDLTVGILAKELDPRMLTVGDVMSPELFTIREQDSLNDALRLMRARGVRRIPVVTHSKALAGILTIDDVLDTMADQLADIVRAVERERTHEAGSRR